MYRFKFHCRVKTNISKPSYTGFIFTDLVYYSIFVCSIFAFVSLLTAGIAGYGKNTVNTTCISPISLQLKSKKIRLKITACGP